MKEGHVALVTGGCRSGKSRYAMQYAEKFLGERNLFIATCVPQDDEMKARVARHQDDREDVWTTREVPLALAETIDAENNRSSVILIDCLTLWMNNLFGETNAQNKIDAFVNRLTATLESASCAIILVTNEIGTGIVPANALARQYRDAVGWMNQAVATVADRVVLSVAGIPMMVKE